MNILFVLGGGIGNIVQATPAIQAISSEGHKVDLKLCCNSSNDMDIFRIPSVRNVFVDKNPEFEYDFQLNGPFTPNTKFKCKSIKFSQINYAQHIAEAEVYYDLAKQIGITTPMPDCKINVGEPSFDIDPETVAIYPGSKPNWAMKRWDKFDDLCNRFKKVAVVGTEQDIVSHGSPAWITKEWKWPDNVSFFTGSLQNMASIISKCKMFVGNDGGLSHVAAATGVPTFVIFGPSSYIKNKPFSSRCFSIGIDLPCRPCQFNKGPDGKQIFDGDKGNCHHNMKCMRDMSVDFVIEKIEKFTSKE